MNTNIPIIKDVFASVFQIIPVDSHQDIANNPQIASKLFSIVAHIFLDFATFVSPDSNALRALVLAGRVLSILSDYIVDNYIAPDELFLQSCLLLMASDAVGKSYIKPLSAYYLREKAPVPSFRDLRVYQKIFRPFGLTWLQYMLLQSSGTIQWVDILKKGDVVFQPESDIILVYTGDAYVWEIDQIIIGDRVQSNKGYSIIGENDLSIFNPTMEQLNKTNENQQQQRLVCIESRSDRLVFLRFDTKRMAGGGGVGMEDRVNALFLLIFHKGLHNRW